MEKAGEEEELQKLNISRTKDFPRWIKKASFYIFKGFLLAKFTKNNGHNL